MRASLNACRAVSRNPSSAKSNASLGMKCDPYNPQRYFACRWPSNEANRSRARRMARNGTEILLIQRDPIPGRLPRQTEGGTRPQRDWTKPEFGQNTRERKVMGVPLPESQAPISRVAQACRTPLSTGVGDRRLPIEMPEPVRLPERQAIASCREQAEPAPQKQYAQLVSISLLDQRSAVGGAPPEFLTTAASPSPSRHISALLL